VNSTLLKRLDRLEPPPPKRTKARGIRILFVTADGEITGEKLVVIGRPDLSQEGIRKGGGDELPYTK
jgi:hypothetical protein